MVSGLPFLDFMLVFWYLVETAKARTLRSSMRGAGKQLIDVFAIVIVWFAPNVEFSIII